MLNDEWKKLWNEYREVSGNWNPTMDSELQYEKHRRLGVLNYWENKELENEAFKIEEQIAIKMIPETAYLPENTIEQKIFEHPKWHLEYAGLFTMFAFFKELKIPVVSDLFSIVLQIEQISLGCLQAWNDIKEIWNPFWKKVESEIKEEKNEEYELKKYLSEKMNLLYGKNLTEDQIKNTSVEDLCKKIKTEYLYCYENNQTCYLNFWPFTGNRKPSMVSFDFEKLKEDFKKKHDNGKIHREELCLIIDNIYVKYICRKYFSTKPATDPNVSKIDFERRLADLIYKEKVDIKHNVELEIKKFSDSLLNNACISAKDHDPSFSFGASVFFKDITEVIMKIHDGLMSCVLPIKQSVKNFNDFKNSDFLKNGSVKERMLYAWDQFDIKNIDKSFENYYKFLKNNHQPTVMDEEKGLPENLDAREKMMKATDLKQKNTNESIREYTNPDGTTEIRTESGDQAAFDKKQIFDESLEAFKQEPNKKTFDSIIDKIPSLSNEKKDGLKKHYVKVQEKGWGYKHLELKDELLNNFDPDTNPQLRAALEDGIFQITGKNRIGTDLGSGFDADFSDYTAKTFKDFDDINKSNDRIVDKELDKVIKKAGETVREEFKSQTEKCLKNPQICVRKAMICSFLLQVAPAKSIFNFGFWLGKKVVFEVVKVPLIDIKDHLLSQTESSHNHPYIAKAIDVVVSELINSNGKIDKEFGENVAKSAVRAITGINRFYRFKAQISKSYKRKKKNASNKAKSKLTTEDKEWYIKTISDYLVQQSTILVEKSTEIISYKLAVSATNANYLEGLKHIYHIVKPYLAEQLCSAVLGYLKKLTGDNYETWVNRINMANNAISGIRDLWNFYDDLKNKDDKTLGLLEFKQKYQRGGTGFGKIVAMFLGKPDMICSAAKTSLVKNF